MCCGVDGDILQIVLIYLVRLRMSFEGFVENVISKCKDGELFRGGLGGVSPPAEILRFIFHLFFLFCQASLKSSKKWTIFVENWKLA